MKVYGLTGGIASGKSEAANRFIELGFPVVDADAVGHALIAPGGEAEADIVATFGTNVLTYGRIDRKKLGALVFSDARALRQLNTIVHPPLKRIILEQSAALANRGFEAVIINAAILADSGVKEAWLDGLILVMSREEERHRRLVELRGMTSEDAWNRIHAQTPPETKATLADWIIENDGTLDELRARVDAVAGQIRNRSSNKNEIL